MSNRQVKIHGGPNNTAATVTGQEELLVKQSMIGSATVVINDTNALTGEFESITVLADAVFTSIVVNGANVVSTLITTPATAVKAGAVIAFGRGQYITSIQLASGSAYAVRR